MGMRSIVLACVIALLSGPLAGTAQADSQPHGVICSLSGKATFSKGLTGEPQEVDFKFTGRLSNCDSSDTSLISGKVEATGSGELSCEFGTSKGTATVTWNNDKTTALKFTTTSVAALVNVETEVTKSNEPATAKGDEGQGALIFEADPQDCSTKKGVQSAMFDGLVGSGGG